MTDYSDYISTGVQLADDVIPLVASGWGGKVLYPVAGATTLGVSLFKNANKGKQIKMIAKSMGDIPPERLLAMSSVAKEYQDHSTLVSDMANFGVGTAAGIAGGAAGGAAVGALTANPIGVAAGGIIGGMGASIGANWGFSALCGKDHNAERMRTVMTLCEKQGNGEGISQSEIFMMLAQKLPKKDREALAKGMENLKTEKDWDKFIKDNDDKVAYVASKLLGKTYDPSQTATAQIDDLIYNNQLNPAAFLVDDKYLPVLARQMEDAAYIAELDNEQGVDVGGPERPLPTPAGKKNQPLKK